MSKRNLPAVTPDGAVMALASGKGFARNAVLTAFQMIGGTERLAEWADENPGEFYKGLFSKTITREADVHHTIGVEDSLDELDELDDAIDAEFDEVDDDE